MTAESATGEWLDDGTVLRPGEVEAVNFGEFRPWHAVLIGGANRTLCGLNANHAMRMWQRWADRMDDPCVRCERSVARLLPPKVSDEL